MMTTKSPNTVIRQSKLNKSNNKISNNNNNNNNNNNSTGGDNGIVSPLNQHPDHVLPQIKAGHILSKVYLNHHSDNNSSINSVNSHLLQLPGIKLNNHQFPQQPHHNNNNSNENNQNNNNINDIHNEIQNDQTVIPDPNSITSLIKRSSGGSIQRIVDPDEEPLNIYSLSGFFHKSLIFLISLLPTFLVEKLLLLFAWIQLELLKAKGRNLGGSQQSFSKLKKKRKSQKKKKNKLNLPTTSTSTAAILSSPLVPTTGSIPVAHSKSSPLVPKHQRRFSLTSSTPGTSSILKSHTKPPLGNGNSHNGSSNNLVGLNHSNSNNSLNGSSHSGINHLNAIKDKLLQQQQKHLQQRHQANQHAQQAQQTQHVQQAVQQPTQLLFPTSTFDPDKIPETIATSTPGIDNDRGFVVPQLSVETTPELESSKNGLKEEDEEQPTTAIDLNKVNYKHRPSVTELESDSDGSNSSVTNLKVTFSDNNHYHHDDLNPNDIRLTGHQMSQENLMLQQQASLQQPPIRQRSDSISVLPSMIHNHIKPISEIRRVNSEQTLFQSSEDTLRFEANQQSKKEFEDFLRSVKDIKDVHNWLRNFSCSATKKVAIVKISRRILDSPYGIECAASSLCFMYKFGLYPIVIHGGMNDISKLPISEVVRERRSRSALLKEAIKKNGVGCSVLTPDICEIEPFIQPDTMDGSDSNLSGDEIEYGQNDILPSGGLNMKIDSFDYDILTQVLDKGKIPIWDSVCESIDGVDIPINSDITTFELAKRIQPYKILFACNDGGILDSDHKAIPVVYMDQDYQTLVEADHTTNRRRVQLKQMKRIVDHLPSSTTVVVTSIENVTHQLLFPRLANGTIIKKSEDNKVLIFDQNDYKNIDMTKLCQLIEDSFGKRLAPDYFNYLSTSLYKLYLCVSSDGEYNGCAIVTFKEPDYIPYLCKFCVKKNAQGLGLGDLIWRALQRDNDKLYWRSRNSNPLNPWYFQRCQGSFRADESFTIFWYGDDKFEDGSSLIEEALRKPVTIGVPEPTIA